MKKLLFFIILLALPVVLAEPVNDYNNAQSLTLNVDFSNEFTLESTGDKSKIIELIANVSLVPRNTQYQRVDSIRKSSNPYASIEIKDNLLLYKWSNPPIGNFDINYNARIITENKLPIIRNKISFPLNLENHPYTEPTEFIDINEGIRNQALELAQGETDAYVVVFKLADWVGNNVKYDLSTLTAEVVQKSSWVFENKEGVCDELTNLFISMSRSVGIPARFVSGLAYTNTKHEWVSHGWAEVYFPDVGWVPVDVTYGQIGWVDPTHITLKENIDSGDSSVKYSWKALETEFKSGKIEVKANLASLEGEVSPYLSLEAESVYDKVGPGSYVPVKVTIENNNEFYVPANLFVSVSHPLLDKNSKRTILRPGETKELYWIVQIPIDVERGFSYSSVFEVQDYWHEKASTNISYGRGYDLVSIDEARAYVESHEINGVEEPSEELDVICFSNGILYIYEDVKIECKLKNKGNVNLYNLDICLNDKCKKENLALLEQKDLIFELGNLDPGEYVYDLTISNDQIDIKKYVNIKILTGPDVGIIDVKYPNKLNYREQGALEFTFYVNNSLSNVNMMVNKKSILALPYLDNNKKVTINFQGREIFRNNNTIELAVVFRDQNNKEYILNKKYLVEINQIPWYINFFKLVFGI